MLNEKSALSTLLNGKEIIVDSRQKGLLYDKT